MKGQRSRKLENGCFPKKNLYFLGCVTVFIVFDLFFMTIFDFLFLVLVFDFMCFIKSKTRTKNKKSN